MRFSVALFALVTASAIPAAAYASPVYSQPYTTTNGYVAYVGSVTPYDNFTLSSTATIGSVDWDGVILGTAATSFTIDFYANNGGIPGALLLADSVGSSDATDTGSTSFGDEIDSYDSSLATSFVAAAGTEYWISIVGNTNSEFHWSTGSGGNGTAYLGTASIPTDLAFTLNSSASPTPEPSSLILLGTGLVGAAGMARRRLLGMRSSQA